MANHILFNETHLKVVFFLIMYLSISDVTQVAENRYLVGQD